jgi:hypothetical protein
MRFRAPVRDQLHKASQQRCQQDQIFLLKKPVIQMRSLAAFLMPGTNPEIQARLVSRV